MKDVANEVQSVDRVMNGILGPFHNQWVFYTPDEESSLDKALAGIHADLKAIEGDAEWSMPNREFNTMFPRPSGNVISFQSYGEEERAENVFLQRVKWAGLQVEFWPTGEGMFFRLADYVPKAG